MFLDIQLEEDCMFFILMVSVPHLTILINSIDKLLLLHLLNKPIPDNRSPFILYKVLLFAFLFALISEFL